MKHTLLSVALVIIAMSAAQSARADVKIKSRQSVSGQTYENTTFIKGKRQRTESMNGAMISLTQCDLRRGVQLNPTTKTFMVNPFGETTQTTTTTAPAGVDKNGVVQAGGTITTTYTIKDTGERKQMFGFTARHLIITMESVSSPDACNRVNTKMQTDGWYIDAEFFLDCDFGYASYGYKSGKPGGCQDKYAMKTVGTGKRGYPLYEKMTMFDENGKETFSTVNEVIELSKATLEASLFDIPADYREVSDASQMYAAAASSSMSMNSSNTSTMKLPNTNVSTLPSSSSGATQSVMNAGRSESGSEPVGPKKEGTVRIGLAGVKTGAVGDGITAADLAAAVQNTMASYLKAPNLEVVTIDAKLASAVASEAQQKECDFVIVANVSHKKGGGGFGGMFGQALGTAIAHTGIGHTGSTVGNIAGQVAAQTIITATTVSANVKAKDEVTLDIKLNKLDGTSALAKVYKAKAKSNGDDIISQVVEQAAQAIVDAAGM